MCISYVHGVASFEWDEHKNISNKEKHLVDFYLAQRAFLDLRRVIVRNDGHSSEHEPRYFCLGLVEGVVMTVVL